MTIEQRAKELAKLKLGALRAKYHEVFGTETKSNNRPYLIKKLLQENQARSTATDTATASSPAGQPVANANGKAKRRERDSRIPPVGTVLERDHDGKTIKVKVVEEGFLYKGKTWRSLSAVAKEATGTVWNGLLFFGLVKRAKTESAE